MEMGLGMGGGNVGTDGRRLMSACCRSERKVVGVAVEVVVVVVCGWEVAVVM